MSNWTEGGFLVGDYVIVSESYGCREVEGVITQLIPLKLLAPIEVQELDGVALMSLRRLYTHGSNMTQLVNNLSTL